MMFCFFILLTATTISAGKLSENDINTGLKGIPTYSPLYTKTYFTQKLTEEFVSTTPNKSLSPWTSNVGSTIKYGTEASTWPPILGDENHLFQTPAFIKIVHPPITFVSEKLPSLLYLFRSILANSTSTETTTPLPTTKNTHSTKEPIYARKTTDMINNIFVPFISRNFTLPPRQFRTPVYETIYRPIQATQIDNSSLVPRQSETPRTIMKPLRNISKLVPPNSILKTILKPISETSKLNPPPTVPIPTRNLNIPEEGIKVETNSVTAKNEVISSMLSIDIEPLQSIETSAVSTRSLPNPVNSTGTPPIEIFTSQEASISYPTTRASIANEPFFSSLLNSQDTYGTSTSSLSSTKILKDNPFLMPYGRLTSSTNSNIDQNSAPLLVSLTTSPKNDESKTEKKLNFIHPPGIVVHGQGMHIKRNVDLIKNSPLPLIPVENELYYLGNTTQATYFAASHFCRSHHMDLLSIETKREQIAIEKLLNEANITGIWTSAIDLAEEGKFVWLSTGKAVQFSAWAPNQPDNAGSIEDCVEIVRQLDGSFAWEDSICDSPSYFICEVRTCNKFCVEPEIIANIP